MIPDNPIKAIAEDERVGKVFIALAEGMRKCLVCEKVFSRQGSFEHSKFPCHLPVSTAN
jgi:hypothetical protein